MTRMGQIGVCLFGAVTGALLGSSVFYLLLTQGYYALVLPGAGLGLGVNFVADRPSKTRGYLSAIAAVALGLLLEAWFRPWIADESLLYFVKNITKLGMVTWLMIVAGAGFAFWWGSDARRKSLPSTRAQV